MKNEDSISSWEAKKTAFQEGRGALCLRLLGSQVRCGRNSDHRVWQREVNCAKIRAAWGAWWRWTGQEEVRQMIQGIIYINIAVKFIREKHRDWKEE